MPDEIARASIDPDPLFEFTTELPRLEGQPAAEFESAQPAVPATDAAAVTVAADAEEWRSALQLRVDALEQRLSVSSAEVLALTAQVATLVAATEDIKKRMRQRAPSIPPPAATARSRAIPITVAITCCAIGLFLAALLWLRSTGADMPPAPAPVSVAEREPPPPTAIPTPQPVLEPVVAALAVQNPPVRDRRAVDEAPPRSSVENYVGTLSIDADPGGEVFINRQAAGKTPLRVANLRAGAHLVWIEREGYRRWTRVVEVTADRVTRLTASLEPLPSR